MKAISIAAFTLAMLLGGCSSQNSADADSASIVGSDRDAHGCIGSAGYSWCARTEQCERPWELAKQSGFENTPGNFTKYCGE